MKKQVNRIDWLNSQLAEAKGYVDRYEKRLIDRPNSSGLRVALASWLSQKEEIEEMLLIEAGEAEAGTIETRLTATNDSIATQEQDFLDAFNSIKDLLNEFILSHQTEITHTDPNEPLSTKAINTRPYDYFDTTTNRDVSRLKLRNRDIGITACVFDEAIAAMVRTLYAESYHDLVRSVALNGIGVAKQYALLLKHLASKRLETNIKLIPVNSRSLLWIGTLDRIKAAHTLFESLKRVQIREITLSGKIQNRSLSAVAVYDTYRKADVEILCNQIQRTILLNTETNSKIEINAIEYLLNDEDSGETVTAIGGVTRLSTDSH